MLAVVFRRIRTHLSVMDRLLVIAARSKFDCDSLVVDAETNQPTRYGWWYVHPALSLYDSNYSQWKYASLLLKWL